MTTKTTTTTMELSDDGVWRCSSRLDALQVGLEEIREMRLGGSSLRPLVSFRLSGCRSALSDRSPQISFLLECIKKAQTHVLHAQLLQVMLTDSCSDTLYNSYCILI